MKIIILFLILFISGCDSTPPKISIVEPKSGAIIFGKTMIKYEQYDNKKLMRTELIINDSISDSHRNIYDNGKYQWDTFELDEGEYKIVIRSYDANGNSADSEPILLKIDYPGDSFSKSFGNSNDNVGRSIQQTKDGGYIIAGYTSKEIQNYRFSNVWLIKTNSYGVKQWDKKFDIGILDKAFSVKQTKDEGYIITGYTSNNNSISMENYLSKDILLIKTDKKGNQKWVKTFDGTKNQTKIKRRTSIRNSNSMDIGYDVQQTKDNGYIIVGHSSYSNISQDIFKDIWLIKTDSNGNELWDEIFDGYDKDSDEGRSVKQTKDGGYIVAGYTTTQYSGAILNIIKTDSNGNKTWTKVFSENDYVVGESGYSVEETNDGGFIICGGSLKEGAKGKKALIYKLRKNGTKEWSTIFYADDIVTEYSRNKDMDQNAARSIQQTKDGGYIIAGYCGYPPYYSKSFAFKNPEVGWLIKINAKGDKEWSRTFAESPYNRIYSVQQTKDRGYVMTGLSQKNHTDSNDKESGNSNIWLIKTDNRGFLHK